MADTRKPTVFDQTYQHYLAEIKKIDYLARAELLGARVQNKALIIPLYERLYAVSASSIESVDNGEANDAVRVILGKYVLTCPEGLPVISKKWVTYREFRDGAPLVSYFTTNTNKNIESHFSGKIGLLKDCCERLGGLIEENDSYDLSVTFHALPRIPVILNFNDSDDLFPATCSILYQESAQHYLDMECLAMTGTLLAGKLLSS